MASRKITFVTVKGHLRNNICIYVYIKLQKKYAVQQWIKICRSHSLYCTNTFPKGDALTSHFPSWYCSCCFNT